jgi:hypothetical protein
MEDFSDLQDSILKAVEQLTEKSSEKYIGNED